MAYESRIVIIPCELHQLTRRLLIFFKGIHRKHFMPRLYIYGVLGIADQRFLVHRQ